MIGRREWLRARAPQGRVRDGVCHHPVVHCPGIEHQDRACEVDAFGRRGEALHGRERDRARVWAVVSTVTILAGSMLQTVPARAVPPVTQTIVASSKLAPDAYWFPAAVGRASWVPLACQIPRPF